MNYLLDFIPLLFCLIGLLQGYLRGAVYELIHLSYFIIAFLLAKIICPVVTDWVTSFHWMQSISDSVTQSVQSGLLSTVHSYLNTNTFDAEITQFGQGVAEQMVYWVLFILVMFLMISLLKGFMRMTKKINHVPVIGCLNQLLGGMIGAVYQCFWCYILYQFVFWLSLTFNMTTLAQGFYQSIWYSLLL